MKEQESRMICFFSVVFWTSCSEKHDGEKEGSQTVRRRSLFDEEVISKKNQSDLRRLDWMACLCLYISLSTPLQSLHSR